MGIGNSGADIVTELGMINGGGMKTGAGEVVNDQRSETLLIARSGGWVAKAPHLEVGVGMMAGEAVIGDFINRQPWFHRDKGGYDEAQEQLNRHGMTPVIRQNISGIWCVAQIISVVRVDREMATAARSSIRSSRGWRGRSG